MTEQLSEENRALIERIRPGLFARAQAPAWNTVDTLLNAADERGYQQRG